jgi:hypothetical protein
MAGPRTNSLFSIKTSRIKRRRARVFIQMDLPTGSTKDEQFSMNGIKDEVITWMSVDLLLDNNETNGDCGNEINQQG